MIHKYQAVLELDKVLKRLSQFAVSEDAVKMALSLCPSQNPQWIEQELNKTDAAMTLSLRFGRPSFSGVKNPTEDLAKAATGVTLSIPSLLNLGAIFQQARFLKKWRLQCESDDTSLDDEFSKLQENKAFENRLNQTFLSEDRLSDHASEQLFRIRRDIARQSEKIKESLEKLLRSGAQKYLQEHLITIRDNRYVVPVKAEYRSQVPGLVHDVSSSGATVFVEPVSVVEANNDIRILMAKEREEIEGILKELSNLAVSNSNLILANYQTIILLDFCFAKAAYAIELKGTKPTLSEKPYFNLKEARHPLLDSETVVPISIELGDRYDTLLITGPNTGGKTVALKTTGLFVLMAECGLLLPTTEGSVLYPFDAVLADIGDEQSIEQSLSTFSAHMSHMIEILSVITPNSLVLLDELGSGTDPLEGAALAEAILEEIRERGALLMATTHYAELKSYALQTDGVENASCEFDIETLSPTYRLLIGVPGRSNAFAISKQLGLSEKLIDRARRYQSEEGRRFEDVISALEAARKKYEEEYLTIIESGAVVKELRAQLEANETALLEQQEEKIQEASKRAKYIVDEVQSEANRIIGELEELRRQKNKEDAAELLAKAKSLRSGEIGRMYDVADPVIERKQENYQLPCELRRGDTVLIYSMNKQAQVLENLGNSKKALVQFGQMKMRVDVKDLRLLEKGIVKKPAFSTMRTVHQNSPKQVSAELDLRSKNVEEALLELDQFIDHAVLANLNQITIIHGKGTGVLRKAVQSHLKSHPNIRSYRLGVFGEGDSGVTIAQL